MMAKQIWKILVSTFITPFFLFPLYAFARDTHEPAQIPSLISCIRIDTSLDFCGEKVPLEDVRVREQLEKKLMYSIQDRAQVILWMKRANRYMPVIEKLLKQHQMPDDLKYIALVESALRPHAVSTKDATGFWQFMKGTGLKYNLTINKKIDERRNIYASTNAAILYLKELYNEFGSWTLAAAAYNMGEKKLREEIAEQKTNDFYYLYLYLETQFYIYKIISVKLVLSNPEQYGFYLKPEDLYPPLSFDRIKLHCAEDLPILIVAQAAGTHFSTIKVLNPELRGKNITKGKHTLAIPKGAAKGFSKRYKKFYTQWISGDETEEVIALFHENSQMNFNSHIPNNISQNWSVPDKQGAYPYTIHISSYRSKKNAINHTAQLRDAGIPAFTSRADIPGKGIWHRVFIGFFGSIKAAKKYALKLNIKDTYSAKAIKYPYAVQVGKADAFEKLKPTAANLQAKGYTLYITHDRQNKNNIRLLIGAFHEKQETMKIVNKLQREGFQANPVLR